MTTTPEEKIAMASELIEEVAQALFLTNDPVARWCEWEGEYVQKGEVISIADVYRRAAKAAIDLICERMEERVRAETAFQDRVKPWLLECFGPVIAADKLERCDRFIEEALELVQACDYDQARAHALVDYVFGRPIGEPSQEVGGVMVTLAALCLAHHLDMQGAGETELARILRPEIVAKIRAKQAAKPTGSALPIAIRETPHAEG